MEKVEMLTIVSGMEQADLRLYFSDGDQKGFWRYMKEAKAYSVDVSEIAEEGKRLRDTLIPELTYSLFSTFERTGSRLEYERVYFERRRILNTSVLLSLLEPEQEEHLTWLEDILWSICNEYTWCLPAHLGSKGVKETIDLFSAETGFALSEINLLLADRLSLLLKLRIKEEVGKRLFVPYLTCGPYPWETATHNWAAVCAGSIGSAALLMLEDSEMLAELLLRVESSMGCYLQGFGGDGACLEGLGYWNYGFGYFVYYADLLRNRSKGQLDWFKRDKVRSIAEFQQKCFLGDQFIANFSDSQSKGSVQLGLSHYIADIYPDVEAPPLSLRATYQEDHCSRWAPTFRNLIWRNTASEMDQWGNGSYFLPDAQWLLSRHASSKGAFGFAAKGGKNDEPHNHNDLGQFILFGEGNMYISDLGSGEYTSGYFGAERYSYDCNGSQGHCVPIIEGHYQKAGTDAYAVILEAVTREKEDVLVLDLAHAYPSENLERLTRSFVWRRGVEALPSLTMVDEFHFREAPSSLIERIISLCLPVLEGDVVILRAPAQQGRIQGLCVIYDVSKLQPVIGDHSYRDHFGIDRTWYSVDFHALGPEKEEKYRFEFQFLNNSN